VVPIGIAIVISIRFTTVASDLIAHRVCHLVFRLLFRDLTLFVSVIRVLIAILMPPAIHQRLAIQAAEEGTSINALIVRRLA